MLDVGKMHSAIRRAHDGEIPVSFVSDGEGYGSWVVEVEPGHKVVLGRLSRAAAELFEAEHVA